MASDELEKYRSIEEKDKEFVFPGDTLFFEGDKGSFEVEVVGACKEDCTILVNGERVTVSWKNLRVRVN